jgi:hypothetical protein
MLTGSIELPLCGVFILLCSFAAGFFLCGCCDFSLLSTSFRL